MSELFKKAIVEKRNILNELRSNNMTLPELRFFSIYLSKIDPFNINTRVVRFPIEDFQRIMGLGRLNIAYLRTSADNLLCKLVHIPDEDGQGMRSFQLFKECHLFQENEKWYIEIDAHDKSLPLMFDFKNRYFKYELWNALRLKSANQIRMYEILKQYENIGRREIAIPELKELLGINEDRYSGRTGWSDFKKRVLDDCQEMLKQATDICYTYERGKSGKGGKWLSVIFHIEKNTEYISPLSLDEFIDMQIPHQNSNLDSKGNVESSVLNKDEYEEIDYGSDLANLLGSAALNDEFLPEQVRVLQDLVIEATSHGEHLEMCNYLKKMVNRMNTYKPKNRFKYLCKMIEADIDDEQ